MNRYSVVNSIKLVFTVVLPLCLHDVLSIKDEIKNEVKTEGDEVLPSLLKTLTIFKTLVGGFVYAHAHSLTLF